MDLQIEQMVGERRKALGDIALDAEPWGLALSGGGIRSATFCYGLLHALARKGALLRFDLMSTVSGGGYIGAMLGRLLQRSTGTAQLRQMVNAFGEGNTTWFSWWLRANGRYLVPRGIQDQLYALAIYVRNFIGIHVELGVAGLILGGLLAVVNLLGWQALHDRVARSGFGALEPVRDVLAWLPTLWVLLPLLAGAALVVLVAYWLVPLMVQGVRLLIGMCVTAFVLYLLWRYQAQWIGGAAAAGQLARESMWWAGILIATAWLLAPLIVVCLYLMQTSQEADPSAGADRWQEAILRTMRRGLTDQRSGIAQDQARHQATNALAWLLQAMAVVALLGVLDRAAWWLAFEFHAWADAGLWLSAAAVGLRALFPLLSKLQAGRPSTALLLLLANVLGRLLTFCLFTWWVAVVHMAALGAMFNSAGRTDLQAAWLPTLAILLGGLAYAALTGWNVEFLNLSSLHGFYRARLVRSYLGASNAGRFFGDRPAPPLGAADRLPADPQGRKIKNVADVDADDDLAINAYRPHAHGGPVHLINVCLNETRDPRGGLFNRDRKGRPMVVAPGGLLRVGQQPWRALRNGERSLTLGSWTAISGAAVSSALGRLTRGGVASLAMFAGARLGFWWDSSALDDTEQPSKRRRPLPAKLLGVLSEARGTFAGIDMPDWYLTDGGHFENTGAYELMAQRCKLIVLADCGADPDYRFRDLENLVRKARIDLRAEIEFLRPKKEERAAAYPGVSPPALLPFFGSLNDLHSDKSSARYTLARIIYSDEDAAGQLALSIGHLVVVKPNLFAGLPVDLANFKAENPAFPQQSTADQFFDEAQWESHFKLGNEFGRLLTIDALSQLRAQGDRWFVKDDGTPIDQPEGTASGDAAATRGGQTAEGRLPARLTTPAVAAFGLGTAAAAGVAVWQAIDSVRKSLDDRTREERMVLKELTDLQAKLPTVTAAAAKPAEAALAAGATAAVLNRLSDSLCPSNEADWFKRSALASEVLNSARFACEAYGAGSMACNGLLNASDPFAVHTRASCLATGIVLAQRDDDDGDCTPYWAWDYRSDAFPRCAHPNDRHANARRDELAVRRKDFNVVVIDGDAQELVPAPGKLCSGVTVVPMVYAGLDEPYVKHVASYLSQWRWLGARITDTENLLQKAAMQRRTPPLLPPTAVLRYHESVPRQCVDQLVKVAMEAVPADGKALDSRKWRIEAGSPMAPVRMGGIEVRIPPPLLMATTPPVVSPPKHDPERDALQPMASVVVLNVLSQSEFTECKARPARANGKVRRPPGPSRRTADSAKAIPSDCPVPAVHATPPSAASSDPQSNAPAAAPVVTPR